MSLLAAIAAGRMTGEVRPMKYSLRSLMIVAAVLPPLLASAWFAYRYLFPADEGFNGVVTW
jgi:hypothetical protein